MSGKTPKPDPSDDRDEQLLEADHPQRIVMVTCLECEDHVPAKDFVNHIRELHT